ncbi:MAG: hypothetical protein IIB17_01140 [Chloroflexi bacterium]|nr:hypothetical protein [Chloroflexota bacterium]
MNDNFKFAMLFPILAILCIVAYAGSLGVIFMIIDTTALEEIGVIALGSALVILVPLVAYMLERNTERG